MTAHEPVTAGTGQWVVLTRYQPPNGHAIVNVYGPYRSRAAAIGARRQRERANRNDPRRDLVEYRVREIMTNTPGVTS